MKSSNEVEVERRKVREGTSYCALIYLPNKLGREEFDEEPNVSSV
jgi:hypothetical protein